MRPVHVRGSDALGDAQGLATSATWDGVTGSALTPSDKTDKTDKAGLRWVSDTSVPVSIPCLAACSHFVMSAPKDCRVHCEKALRPPAPWVRGWVKVADAVAFLK